MAFSFKPLFHETIEKSIFKAKKTLSFMSKNSDRQVQVMTDAIQANVVMQGATIDIFKMTNLYISSLISN